MNMTKLCPRCKLPMNNDNALNALSHDGAIYICSLCGEIESWEKFDPSRAYGLRVAQLRAQAATYGINPKTGNPNLPSIDTESTTGG